MCTAMNIKGRYHYFGRNLDLEYTYNEAIIVTPRKYPFFLRFEEAMFDHYAMVGVATVIDNYPLYYDAANEHGLCIAGLNFPGNAHYFPVQPDKINLAPFELIPWILGNCKNLEEVKATLININVADEPFSKSCPNTPLHWMVAYKDLSIVIEQTKDGLIYYENPIGILTNNPPFPYHLWNICNYTHLSSTDPINVFSPDLKISPYSRGMGAIGLPGDYSSTSRFIRAAFLKLNSIINDDETSNVMQFFHVMNAVAMPSGAVLVDGKPEITIYTSCCNADKGIYYYNTYENSQIMFVKLFNENLDSKKLVQYPLYIHPEFRSEN